MKEIEETAKTVQEAVQAALEQLGVDEEQVEVTVLREGKSGVLGLGVEEAKVKVKLLAQPRDGDVVKVAREVAETLIESMGLDAEVTATQATKGNLPVALDIEGDDLGILIGRRGQTLASLQYIIRLIVAEKLKMWVPINVDIAGYKKRRYESLRSLALRLAEQVKTSRHLITLEPMPADERRIIHLTLADTPDVVTESMGEGEGRKVAILFKKR